MTIEKAVAADSAAIATVLVESIRELCGADHRGEPEAIASWTANKTPETVASWIADPNVHVLVGRRDGAVMAVGSFAGDTILLNYVSPRARFGGFSTAMLQAMEDGLAATGVAVAKLTSTQTAHRFYQARGWQDTGCQEVRGGGVSCIVMSKRLGVDG